MLPNGCYMHLIQCAGLQSGMSESKNEDVEIQEIAAEDMKIILNYTYGILNALPEERLHPLIRAVDRLQVCYPSNKDNT